jgi:hypothetical protein
MKNVYKIFLLLILGCTAGISQAQTVHYTIVEDNPYFSNFQVNLLPFYVDAASNNNLSLGFAVEAKAVVKKLVTLNLYWEHPYAAGMDWGYHFATVGIFSTPTKTPIVHFQHFELGGTYHLRERTKVKTRNVTLKSTSDGRYNYTTSIGVPTTVLVITGIRAGLYSYKTAITARQYGTVQGDLGDKGVISSDGTHFGGAANLNASGVKEDPYFNTESSTNMRVLGIYAGISTTHTHRVILDADGYGRKGMEKWTNFFADVIIAPVRIDDFQGTNGKNYALSGGQAKGFETRPFGLRAGYEYSFVRKHVGFYAKTEMGMKPGLSKSHFYCMLTWGLTIHGKIKALAAEKQ